MKKKYTTPVLQKIDSIGRMTQASSGSNNSDNGSGSATAPNKVS